MMLTVFMTIMQEKKIQNVGVTGTDFMVLRTNENRWSLEYFVENRIKKYGS
jgi:hypothetical protein